MTALQKYKILSERAREIESLMNLMCLWLKSILTKFIKLLKFSNIFFIFVNK